MVLEGKSASHLATRAVVKSGRKNVEEAFQHIQLFSYNMLNSSEVLQRSDNPVSMIFLMLVAFV